MIINSEKFTPTDEHINALKVNYKELGYKTKSDSPKWITVLDDICSNDLGILALNGPNGVNISPLGGFRERIYPDLTSVFISAISDLTSLQDLRISISTPPIGNDLPLLMACVSVLKKTIEHRLANSDNNKGILIVSREKSIRSQYCDLRVNQEKLDKVYPGSRLSRDGVIKILSGSNLSSTGVCFFLPWRKLLPTKIDIKPDLVILDLRFGRLTKKYKQLIEWTDSIFNNNVGIVALHTIGDFKGSKILKDTNFTQFPIDHSAVKSIELSSNIPVDVGDNSPILISFNGVFEYLERKHIIKEVKCEPEVFEMFSHIAEMLTEYKGKSTVELNRIRWLNSVFKLMPVPIDKYEIHANKIGKFIPNAVIQRIGSLQKLDPQIEPAVLQTFRLQFTELRKQFIENNPKSIKLKNLISTISKNLNEENKLLIIVKNIEMEQALESWLELTEFKGKNWLKFVDIIAVPNFYTIINQLTYSYSILTGPISIDYKWILGSKLGKEIYFLAYADEIEIIKNQINIFYDHNNYENNLRIRYDSLKQVGITSQQKNPTESPIFPSLLIEENRIKDGNLSGLRVQKGKTKVKSFEELLDLHNMSKEKSNSNNDESLYDEIDDDILELSYSEIQDRIYERYGISSFKITVMSAEKGKGIYWINENSIVECARFECPDDIIRTTPDKLKIKDLLLIIDDYQQHSLFDKVIEIVDSNPRIRHITKSRKYWRKAVNKLSIIYQDKYGQIDYSKMYDNLKASGIKIKTEATLKNWVNDVVIGPESKSSIIAVGKTSHTEELITNSSTFHKDFEKIRSLHRTIGRRIAAIIRKSFFKDIKSEEVMVSKEYIGLSADEIADAIEIVEVLEVEKENDKIDPCLLNKFIKI